MILYWKALTVLTWMKGGLGEEYGFLIVQPIFLEASSFHNDTRGHYNLTFLFEGT